MKRNVISLNVGGSCCCGGSEKRNTNYSGVLNNVYGDNDVNELTRLLIKKGGNSIDDGAVLNPQGMSPWAQSWYNCMKGEGYDFNDYTNVLLWSPGAFVINSLACRVMANLANY